MTLYANVGAFNGREVHTGNDFAVDHEENAVASQKFWQIGVVAGAADDFVHGVADGFEFLQLLDLSHYGGLVHIYAHGAVAHESHQVQKAYSRG
jgi:hypothetical protein